MFLRAMRAEVLARGAALRCASFESVRLAVTFTIAAFLTLSGLIIVVALCMLV